MLITDNVATPNLPSLYKIKGICSCGPPWKVSYEVGHYWILSKGDHMNISYIEIILVQTHMDGGQFSTKRVHKIIYEQFCQNNEMEVGYRNPWKNYGRKP